jgi:uncharacterized protein (TIGR02217 family)
MTTSFHNVRFPTAISLKARGGPQRRTDIVQLSSGHEQRNTRWADSRRSYNAGYGIVTLDDLDKVIAFFEQRRGQLYGFRWKDHADYKSCPPLTDIQADDQIIATGDGVTASFQLQKTYGETSSWTRIITKPVADTIKLAVAGIDKLENVDFQLDEQSGLITFEPGAIPDVGDTITAGFEFDVPVRFDTDFLEVSLSAFNAGQIPDIAIIEIKQ